MTTYVNTLNELRNYANLLERRDFKTSYYLTFWKKEMSNFNPDAMGRNKKIATYLLDYLDDFSKESYYVRDEIEWLLNRLIEYSHK